VNLRISQRDQLNGGARSKINEDRKSHTSRFAPVTLCQIPKRPSRLPLLVLT